MLTREATGVHFSVFDFPHSEQTFYPLCHWDGFMYNEAYTWWHWSYIPRL